MVFPFSWSIHYPSEDTRILAVEHRICWEGLSLHHTYFYLNLFIENLASILNCTQYWYTKAKASPFSLPRENNPVFQWGRTATLCSCIQENKVLLICSANSYLGSSRDLCPKGAQDFQLLSLPKVYSIDLPAFVVGFPHLLPQDSEFLMLLHQLPRTDPRLCGVKTSMI